jgi:hypothetical protein
MKRSRRAKSPDILTYRASRKITKQMVSRYSHLSEGHIVATGEKLAQRLGI